MTEVPLIVTDEAAAHVARLGLQRALEQHLDWVRQNVDDLDGIRVKLFAAWGGRTLVVICSHHRPRGEPPYPLYLRDWIAWWLQVLPPEVGSLFLLSPYRSPR